MVRLAREEAYRPSVEKLVVALSGTRTKYVDLLHHYELKNLEVTLTYMVSEDVSL